MIENITKTLSKTVSFEKSGETLTLTVSVVNVSPKDKENIQDLLHTMFIDMTEEL